MPPRMPLHVIAERCKSFEWGYKELELSAIVELINGNCYKGERFTATTVTPIDSLIISTNPAPCGTRGLLAEGDLQDGSHIDKPK